MRSSLIALTLALLFVLAACGPSPEDVAATAQSVAATSIVLTQAAMPTDTPSSTPTDTPEPTATATETLAPTDTQAPTATNTVVAQAPEPTATFSNTSLLLLDNRTDQIIWIVIDTPFYFEMRFSDRQLVTVPWGDFHYSVWIGDKGPYTGNFRINNDDKYTMIIETGKVTVHTP